MVPVQKRHLGGGFEPDLVLGVGGQYIQSLDGEVEVAAVGELADAGAERDEVGTGYVGGALHEGLADVVDLVPVETKAVAARVRVGTLMGGILDDVLEVIAGELEQLLEHRRRLFLVQRSHPAIAAAAPTLWEVLGPLIPRVLGCSSSSPFFD